ncbi:LysE family translocator [Caballeronia sp.]|uniref:LysE family translocator n=1 Tax=Caballeronia sp. TaxID=1931223 RepID=UPI003C5B8E6D
MNEHFFAMLPMFSFAFATSASPGPVNIVAAMSGAQFGIKRSFSYVLGAAGGFVAVLLIVGIGFGSVLVSSRIITNVFAVAGAMYMLYLSFRLAISKSTDTGNNTAPPPRVISGAIAQCLNPKAWIVSISAISIYVANSKDYTLYLSIFCAIFFVVCFFSILGWVIVGSKASSTLNGNYGVFNKVMAGLLALSVIYFIVDFVVLGRA